MDPNVSHVLSAKSEESTKAQVFLISSVSSEKGIDSTLPPLGTKLLTPFPLHSEPALRKIVDERPRLQILSIHFWKTYQGRPLRPRFRRIALIRKRLDAIFITGATLFETDIIRTTQRSESGNLIRRGVSPLGIKGIMEQGVAIELS